MTQHVNNQAAWLAAIKRARRFIHFILLLVFSMMACMAFLMFNK